MEEGEKGSDAVQETEGRMQRRGPGQEGPRGSERGEGRRKECRVVAVNKALDATDLAIPRAQGASGLGSSCPVPSPPSPGAFPWWSCSRGLAGDSPISPTQRLMLSAGICCEDGKDPLREKPFSGHIDEETNGKTPGTLRGETASTLSCGSCWACWAEPMESRGLPSPKGSWRRELRVTYG